MLAITPHVVWRRAYRSVIVFALLVPCPNLLSTLTHVHIKRCHMWVIFSIECYWCKSDYATSSNIWRWNECHLHELKAKAKLLVNLLNRNTFENLLCRYFSNLNSSLTLALETIQSMNKFAVLWFSDFWAFRIQKISAQIQKSAKTENTFLHYPILSTSRN